MLSLSYAVDFHEFCFSARQAIYSMQEKMTNIVADMAIVVEGRLDEELPEQVLGSARISHIELAKAQPWPGDVFLAGKK